MLDDAAGLGVVELVAVLEECGAVAAPLPLLSSAGLVGGVLHVAGPAAQPVQAELAGGAVGALAVSAPGARRLLPAFRVEGERVIGVAGAVADAARADVLVLLAHSADRGVVAAVVRPGPGVQVRPQESIDPTRPLAEVEVDAVAEAVLPVPFPAALALPLTAAAADLVGVASRLLELAVTHALTREQFGRPIGAFQGVKHRLADCYVAVERARSLTYAATMQVADADATGSERWRTALLAKAAAGETAIECARAAVQVHGAMAMTREHDAHLFLRRAWGSAAVLGESRAAYADAAALLVSAG
jgi:alkylation response protein AidB-like acyl-CoA dehydrogenase